MSIRQNSSSAIQDFSTLPENAVPAPRPTWTDINALTFWNTLFPIALTKFLTTSQEPCGRSKTAYSIRENGKTWDGVYDVLERARSKYEQQGKIGGLRRKAADSIAPIAEGAKIASHVVPSNPYSTPILGAVSILLDRAETNDWRIRRSYLNIFRYRVFLGNFPGDNNISNASVDLTVTILLAIERAIGFFITNDFIRGFKAVGMGDSYEKDLLESLGSIKTKSRALLEEATKSQMHKFDKHSQTMQKGQQQILKRQTEQTDTLNSVYALLRDHEKQKEEARKEMQRINWELERSRHTITSLTIQNETLRSISPIQHSMWPPPPHGQPAVYTWLLSQETLRWVVKSPDIDLADMSFINDRRGLLSTRHRAQTEQVVNLQLFRNWIVSPTSTKLMIQWNSQPPKTVAGISPLSVFCTTITQGFRTSEHILSLVWFCGRHIDKYEAGEQVGGHSMLASLIDQLLQQHTFDTRPLCNDFNLTSLQQSEYDELIRLLDWLVRQFSNDITLFIVVDDVVLFERDEHWDQSAPVLSKLLSLVNDTTLPAVIKVLFTSTPGSDIVRAAFEQGDLILEVGRLPDLGSASSDERVARELGDALR
ncbi:hypothetical protein PT974_05351 [Cladobotryum mycophilum]|uniref:Uncharacterized protein n=1 Tax=Cladobotryum mycophilum TaxID=491253 RepID=A0ABR0SJQ8_9HYPO